MHNPFKFSIQIISIMLIASCFCSGCDEEPELLDDLCTETSTDNNSIEGSNQNYDTLSGGSVNEAQTGNNDELGSGEDTDTTKADSAEANPADVDSATGTSKVDSNKADPLDNDSDQVGSAQSDDDTDNPKVSPGKTGATDNNPTVSDVDAGAEEEYNSEAIDEAIAVGNCQTTCFTVELHRIALCTMATDRNKHKACENDCFENTQSCCEKCILTQGSGFTAKTRMDQEECQLACESQELTVNSECLVYLTVESRGACLELAEKNKTSCIETCLTPKK